MSGTFEACPVCDGHSIHIAEWYTEDGSPTYYCVCDDCGHEDPDKFDDYNLARDHWNRRVAKGYVGGEDPTDTVYDKLQEDDWTARSNNGKKKRDDFDAIKW